MQGVSGRRARLATAFVILVTVFSGQAVAAPRRSAERETTGDRLARRFIQLVVTVFSRLGTPPGGG